jgi:hypothetical protein
VDVNSRGEQREEEGDLLLRGRSVVHRAWGRIEDARLRRTRRSRLSRAQVEQSLQPGILRAQLIDFGPQHGGVTRIVRAGFAVTDAHIVTVIARR